MLALIAATWVAPGPTVMMRELVGGIGIDAVVVAVTVEIPNSTKIRTELTFVTRSCWFADLGRATAPLVPVETILTVEPGEKGDESMRISP